MACLDQDDARKRIDELRKMRDLLFHDERAPSLSPSVPTTSIQIVRSTRSFNRRRHRQPPHSQRPSAAHSQHIHHKFLTCCTRTAARRAAPPYCRHGRARVHANAQVVHRTSHVHVACHASTTTPIASMTTPAAAAVTPLTHPLPRPRRRLRPRPAPSSSHPPSPPPLPPPRGVSPPPSCYRGC